MRDPLDIHSASTAQLLKFAFASGAEACDDSGGYVFRVTTRAGIVFEGAPTVYTAEEVGRVLVLLSGDFILTHEIAAITVVPMA